MNHPADDEVGLLLRRVAKRFPAGLKEEEKKYEKSE